MIRHGKRQTRNDYIRERLAGDIDPHPKAIGTKKNAARRGLELIKKFPPWRPAALHQQIKFVLRKELRHSLGHLLHATVTGKKDESTAVSPLDKMSDPLFERFHIPGIAGIRNFSHDEYSHLLFKIERTAEQCRLDLVCSDTLTEINEIPATD